MDTLTEPSHRNGRSRSVVASKAPAKPMDKRDYLIGICLLLLVVFLWTSSNFITQDMFDGGYEKPFLVTYMNTSAFTVYLLPFILRQFGRPRIWDMFTSVYTPPRGRRGANGDHYEPLITDSTPIRPEAFRTPTFVAETNTVLLDDDDTPLTTEETAKLSLMFCFFWFIANWTVNASLDYTSVASTTILSSMSGFFTLGIGRVFHVETLTLSKCAAVLTSFLGVFLVSLSDSSGPITPATGQLKTSPSSILTRGVEGSGHTPRPLLGDSLALLSAIFYAFYVVLLKVRIRSESRIDMQLFFGFVGLFNTLLCWPIGIFLHLTGVEVFELPSSKRVFAAILINMFITLSSDYIYVLAMLKTTPLVVTVGLSLTIPLAVLGDLYLSKPTHGLVIFGALLVLVSFVGIGMESSEDQPEADLLNQNLVDEGRGRQSQLTLRDDTV